MESVWEYRALLLSGTLVTVQLAIGSLLLSVLLGLAGASAKLARNPVSQRLANAYTTLVRGVPDLVLMMLLFYGGQQIFNDLGSVTGLWDYIEINQFTAGVGSIGFVFGAYMTETFRGRDSCYPKRSDRGRYFLRHDTTHYLPSYHLAPNGTPRATQFYQQLAGVDQGHRPGLCDWLA